MEKVFNIFDIFTAVVLGVTFGFVITYHHMVKLIEIQERRISELNLHVRSLKSFMDIK